MTSAVVGLQQALFNSMLFRLAIHRSVLTVLKLATA